MDILFHWVEYKNIMSVGAKPIRIELDHHKKTLVTGTNGAGKSTFIEAITFMLYGKAFRDVPKPLLVNSHNKKGLHVEGEISVGKDKFHIVRGIKPNVLKITKNGEELKEVASATEYQAYFEEKLLGISYDSFKQIIVLGTAGYKPFMELPAGKRRELVEDLLDVSVIGEMDKQNKALIKELKGQQDQNKAMLASAESERATAESAIEAQKKQTGMLVNVLVTNFRSDIDRAKTSKDLANINQEKIDNAVEPVYDETAEREIIAKYQPQALIEQLATLSEQRNNDIADINSDIACLQMDQPFDCALDHDVGELEKSKPTEDDLRAATALVPIPDELVIQDVAEPVAVDYTNEKFKLDNTAWDIRGKISALQERKKFFEKGGACPTCGTDCSSHADHSIEELDSDIEKLEAELAVISDETSRLTSYELNYKRELAAYNQIIEQNREAEREYERATARYAQQCRNLSENHHAAIAFIDKQISEMTLNHERQKVSYNERLNGLYEKKRHIETTYEKAKDALQRRIDSIGDERDAKIAELKSNFSSTLAAHRANLEMLAMNVKTNMETYEEAANRAKDLKKQIDELNATEYDTSKLEEIESRIEEIKSGIADIVLELHRRSIVADMLKDNGVKAHIVKRYIPVFNKKINDYLKSLGADYVFALDEGFNESIKSRGREEFCYASFSEGEKARINLSLLFTWRDVSSMISGVNINLLCMDEVFDGSCDEAGIVGINKMLNDMKSNIIVISHRKDAMDDSFDRHIRMQKQGRFTTMV
ncbi:recombination endonuclease subunit [Aeromonas phage phiAS5]|uniref:Recombination endonuclease subunit n=1 Tax=Aeromonas phage phiAS5 TaxID=879630 RepID=E1A2P8_9CAUD|nr:recombination endonuclease subunit [Aeromonas phage phiAS5]ADM79994.1 recombination endonuclease subunit [Aeromonas phage phiAS5]